ncbi:Origin recognition complex subunit 6 [Lucilia cuprina]|nr:Origin recognition complex subunit 6 [Lucilia cuprina]
MTTLIEQLITKMGLRDEPNVLEKTTELVRLLELRSTNVPLQINEYGKIVLCADIAATLMGIPFDKEQALKMSGLRKSHYANNKRMFEKLLDLNKLVGVNDICLQLNLNQVNKKAEELLELYRKVITSEQSSDVDISHPQYAAMAVFSACKLCKQKVSKTKLMPFSNLKPSQWQQLEQRWEKFMAKHYNDALDNKLKKQNSEDQATATATDDDSSKKTYSDKKLRNEIEDYEKWKKRMLAMAHAKLKEQETGDSECSEQIEEDKGLDFNDVIDNMILGC